MMSACGRGWHLMTAGDSAALKDWLAWPLVGSAAEPMVAQFVDMFGREACLASSAWLAARVRITEAWLADSGASHYVILGAGLDSYAWRQTDGRTVIEVDHPATQQWKRERLAALFLEDPPGLMWAPCDFERESVADALTRVDLGSEPPFVSWIGVTPYLTPDAVAETLRKLPPCMLVVGYCIPEEDWSGPGERPTRIFKELAGQSGESLTTFYTPSEFAAVLSDCGFEPLDDVGPEVSLERFGHEAFSMGFERLALARKTS
jgi:methyltransferase (TIGR00027 family)